MAGKPSLMAQIYAPVLRLLARGGTRVLLVQLGDENPHIAFPQLPPGYTAEAKQPLDLLPWSTPEHGLTESFLRQASERGDRCVVNFFHGDLVGYGFVTRCFAPVTDQVGVRIGAALHYRYKGWTHPEHRRKHLSHARGRLNSRLFPRQEGQRMVSYVEAHNFASRLTHADVRPTFLGLCVIVRVLGREYPINSLAAVRAGFELVRLDRAEAVNA